MNVDTISSVARLDKTLENWSTEGIRRWSWLPTRTPTPFVFSEGQVKGVSKTAAEYTLIVSTDEYPIELWISHEGAVPKNVSADLFGKDPWIQTNESIPWIGEVKYIEVKLRPGNAILIPKHWWYAVRPVASSAWFWIAEFNTPISAIAGIFSQKIDAA